MRLFFGSCISSLEIRNPFKILGFFSELIGEFLKTCQSNFRYYLFTLENMWARDVVFALWKLRSVNNIQRKDWQKKVSIPTWFSRFLGVLEWPKNSLKPKHQSTYYSFPALLFSKYFVENGESKVINYSKFCSRVMKIMKMEFVW